MRNVSQTLLGILREEISEYRRLHRRRVKPLRKVSPRRTSAWGRTP